MYELLKTLPYWLQVSLLLIPVLSFLIAACAFAINVRQTILNNRLGRAKIVSDSLHTFMDDDMMHKAFYKIEYSQFEYDGGFHTSDEEREIDKLLRHFSNLALMWEDGLLSLKDIHPVQYFILRTVNDPEIGKYLSFIDSWAGTAGTGGHPYSSLNNLTKSLNGKVNA
jgi:hypothetical protein